MICYGCDGEGGYTETIDGYMASEVVCELCNGKGVLEDNSGTEP